MLTIPKLIDPLQIALAMLVSPGAYGAFACVHRSLERSRWAESLGVFHKEQSLSTDLST